MVIAMLGRRLALSVVLVVVVPSLTFFLEALSPGNVAQEVLGLTATPAQINTFLKTYGLNEPLYQQYWHWLSQALQGNLGDSYTNGVSVTSELGAGLPVTISLIAGSLLVAILLGVLLGVGSALGGRRSRRAVDILSTVGLAIPPFWLGIGLILVFAVKVEIFPATGYVGPTTSPGAWLQSLVLPCLAIGIGMSTVIAKQTRDQLRLALERPYIRTFRANGASEVSIIFRHALRNAGIPVVTVIGLLFINCLTASVFIEGVFALPGLGSLLATSAQTHDLPSVEGVAICFVLIVMVVNFLVDLTYGWLNPRVR